MNWYKKITAEEKWKGLIPSNGLIPSDLNKFKITNQFNGKCFSGKQVVLSEDEARSLKDKMRYGYFSFAWNRSKLLVILKNKIFSLPKFFNDNDIEPVITYGKTVGVSKKDLQNIKSDIKKAD